jgi:predicted phosphodiesterase
MRSNARPADVRVALLSDLHLDNDVSAFGACDSCGDRMAVRRTGEAARCRCGRSRLRAGKDKGWIGSGAFVSDPPLRGRLGRAVREAGADLVVVPGDINLGASAVAWVAEEFAGLPVAMVAGNRESYGSDLADTLAAMRRAAEASGNVRFLERDEGEWEFRGTRVRALGATMWTDFAIARTHGVGRETAMTVENDKLAQAGERYRVTRDGAPFDSLAKLLDHQASRAWLAERLASPFDGATVVATHHATIPQAVSPKFGRDARTATLASELIELYAARSPELVVSGHTHQDMDLVLGNTRFVACQRGYGHEADPSFSPAIMDL